LKIIREIGVDRIREKSKRMTARLIELADQHGWKVNSPSDPERRGGTVTIDMPNSSSEAVCNELLRRDVLVDWRPKAGVRFSPHFYNTLEEIDRAIQTVDEILSNMRVPASVV
jgi:kynureninase